MNAIKLEITKAEVTSDEGHLISYALGSIRDEKLLRKVLDFAMSSDIRSQDTIFVIISVAMTKMGRQGLELHQG
ncbi:hypothetical protein J6590_080223 [Homalodisca vitripennis]|nr:hypothetical protein J6590_080223 [Homalodisca vitripennis]